MLFKDTYIGNNPTKEASSYYMLRFNFQNLLASVGINVVNERIKENDKYIEMIDLKELTKSFLDKTRIAINSFISAYNLDISLKNDYQNPETLLNEFLSKLEAIGLYKKVFVIIDEYDNFVNGLLKERDRLFRSESEYKSWAESDANFVKAWYENLKEHTETDRCLARIFITGVTPIAFDSLTSGFNIAKRISVNGSYNEMAGFTEKEVIKLIKDLKIESSDELLNDLKANYNGYKFSDKAEQKVYNSTMVLYYLDYYQTYNEAPSNIIDPNIDTDYGKLKAMFDLYNEEELKRIMRENDLSESRVLGKEELINNVISGNKITSALASSLNISKIFGEEQFISLLFYLGYLSIEDTEWGITNFKVPNYAVKTEYIGYLVNYQTNMSKLGVNVGKIMSAIHSLIVKSDINLFIELMENTITNYTSNRDYRWFDESNVKSIMVSFLSLISKDYIIESESPAGKGYTDIALISRNINKHANNYILELKYIAKNDYKKADADAKIAKAIEELTMYSNSEKFKNMENLSKYIILFRNNECIYLEQWDYKNILIDKR